MLLPRLRRQAETAEGAAAVVGQPLQVENRVAFRFELLENARLADAGQAAQHQHARQLPLGEEFAHVGAKGLVPAKHLPCLDAGQVEKVGQRPRAHAATPAVDHHRQAPFRPHCRHLLDQRRDFRRDDLHPQPTRRLRAFLLVKRPDPAALFVVEDRHVDRPRHVGFGVFRRRAGVDE